MGLLYTDIWKGPSLKGGHGAIWADVDGNDLPDLYLPLIISGTRPDLFMHNKGRGVAFADLDNDGDVDFAVGTKRAARNYIIRNDLRDGGNWLKVRLLGANGQAGAFGAVTCVYPASQTGGQLLAVRESQSNCGYLGQNDPVLHFGLGHRTSVDVVVKFVDGTKATRHRVTANQTVLIAGAPEVVGKLREVTK